MLLIFQQIYSDSIYGFHRSQVTAIPNSNRTQAQCEIQLSTSSPDQYSRWNVQPHDSVHNGLIGSQNRSKRDLTYSYSSSDDEDEDESLNGSFGGQAIAKWVFVSFEGVIKVIYQIPKSKFRESNSESKGDEFCQP